MMKSKPGRDRIDGVLLFDKPPGQTSNHAMMAVRRLLAAAKAGHGGTLDPMATGLLPLMLGEATKFAHDLLDADKTYLAELTLGATTDTGDAEGQVVSQAPVTCSSDDVARVALGFVGDIEQTPPMYSALKRDGKPLYEYARAGQTLERAARPVTIHAIDIVAIDLPKATLRVRCSKGTYIRTLAEDIGKLLGCGAHLSALRREAVGGLTLNAAVTLAELETDDLPGRRDRLMSIDSLLGGLPRVELTPELAVRFGNGQRIRLAEAPADGRTFDDLPHDSHRNRPDDEPGESGDNIATSAGSSDTGDNRDNAPRVRVYAGERLLGIATLVQGLLAPLRLISTETPS